MRSYWWRASRGLGLLATGLLCLPGAAEAQWVSGPLGVQARSHPVEWSAAPALTVPQEAEGGSGWKRGFVIGGLIGGATGLLAFLLVDSSGCDSCSGVSDSAADGAGPEFVFGFALLGAGIGALIGR